MGLGMDSRYPATREELYTVQMDIKQLQIASQHHADRLSRLEKRQADDANLRSVWQSPFPSVMGGTPQQDPVQMPANDDFDEDFDPEHGQNLLGSLHLEADDEPVRRGVAASRANSVRFDESALQSASWGHNSRHSGDFGLVRPSSGFGTHGMMERSLSHKSDGRHSSAGHSVHSVHSVPSGRASSLGLDTHFGIGTHEDESPVDVLEPPPGLFVMGPVPSVIRCWLTVNFAHDTLLYAAVCSGSQKSTVDYSLVKELDLMPEVHRDIAGVHRIRLPVFLAEAIVTQRHPRTNGAATQTIPSITTSFEIVGMEQSESTDSKKGIRIFLGCDTLRAHSTDILFSQNTMVLVGDQREKLTVPFARPEDDSVFKYLNTINAIPGKPKLNATAPPFVSTNSSSEIPKVAPQVAPKSADDLASPSASHVCRLDASVASNPSENGGDSCGNSPKDPESATTKEPNVGTPTVTENSRRDSTTSSIWGSWRQGTPASINGGNLDSYSQSSRSGRNMKVLKPMKSSSARTGASYEPPLPSRPSGELRRKSTVGENGSTTSTGGTPAPTPAMRWEQKRASISAESREKAAENTKTVSPLPRASLRSANPVGGASAFSWMNPGTKAKTGTAGGE